MTFLKKTTGEGGEIIPGNPGVCNMMDSKLL